MLTKQHDAVHCAIYLSFVSLDYRITKSLIFLGDFFLGGGKWEGRLTKEFQFLFSL